MCVRVRARAVKYNKGHFTLNSDATYDGSKHSGMFSSLSMSPGNEKCSYTCGILATLHCRSL